MEQNNYNVLKNGVKTITTANHTVMHQCLYCNSWYEPKRRFMQKYCRESCRVLACRNRKNTLFGVEGGKQSDRNATTNTELYNSILELTRNLKAMEHTVGLIEGKNEIATVKSALMLQEEIRKVKGLVQWNLFLSAAMPLLSPPIIQKIKEVFGSNDKAKFTDMAGFYESFKPILDAAPDEIKTQVENIAKNYFDKASKK